MEKYGKSFKELNWKEKISHIWDYYRWPIAGTIVGGALIISFLVAVLTPKTIYDVDVMLAGKLSYDDTSEAFINTFRDEYNVSIDLTMADWETASQVEMVLLQKIPLLIRTEELDILGVDPAQYESFVQRMGTDMFIPLDTIPEAEGLLEKYSDRLYTSNIMLEGFEDTPVEVEEHVYGIRVETFNNIPCIRRNGEFIVGITSMVKDLDKAIELLDYLVQ